MNSLRAKFWNPRSLLPEAVSFGLVLFVVIAICSLHIEPIKATEAQRIARKELDRVDSPSCGEPITGTSLHDKFWRVGTPHTVVYIKKYGGEIFLVWHTNETLR